jgi:peroxiredoxin Q/BCP
MLKMVWDFGLHTIRSLFVAKKRPLQPGERAPDFDLADESGRRHHLSDYAGRPVVLWFFIRANTPGWISEAIGFRDRIQEFQQKNAVLLGISTDTRTDNASFRSKYNFPFPLLSDPSRQTCLAYGACSFERAAYAERITFVVGPDGIILKEISHLPAADHVAAALEALYAGA